MGYSAYHPLKFDLNFCVLIPYQHLLSINWGENYPFPNGNEPII